ncbi:MAG: sigma-54 dependent transcriptional regulator [Pseudomonadota bacterium]
MIRLVATLIEGLDAPQRALVQTVLDRLGWEPIADVARCDSSLPVLIDASTAQKQLAALIAERPTARFLVLGADSVPLALWSLRHGASDYVVVDGSAAASQRLEQELLRQLREHRPRPISSSGAGRAVFRLARRVAATDVAVLLQGPSGSGKEVLAGFVHQHSARASRPFVAVNCAAMPDTMLESLLFGHERGAFTGADRRREGKFQQASGGTLLLDEVTEMPIELQAKLLRAIQEQEVEPLGARQPVAVDVRVIATTNRDPQQAVVEGQLREDLYYRLSVFPIRVPSLAERNEDVVPLAQQVLNRFGSAEQIEAGFSGDALEQLRSHSWPGNVRELENTVRRGLVMNEVGPVCAADLGLASSAIPSALNAPVSTGAVEALATAQDLRQRLVRQEDQLVLDALKDNDFVRSRTAAVLGISERTLRNKLRRLRDEGLLDTSAKPRIEPAGQGV